MNARAPDTLSDSLIWLNINTIRQNIAVAYKTDHVLLFMLKDFAFTISQIEMQNVHKINK